MQICGLQKLSMVDYPGKLAATVFTGGCNLRCPFCHNALLVTRLPESPSLDAEEVLDFLKHRRGLLDGVVLTGGEPLLHPDAADFLKAVRDLGFSVKLDTNGCFPQALAAILDAGLVDDVAMDIKNSPARYSETVGVPGFDLGPIRESIALLEGASVAHEFRTTLVRELHTQEDLFSIAEWIHGAPRYALQKFVDSGALIEEGRFHPWEDGEMRSLTKALRPSFGEVLLRGVE